MKILVVCQHYYPEQFRITDICEELVKRGHQVTVLTGLPNYPMGYIYPGYKDKSKRREIINGVDVRRTFTIGRRSGIAFRVLNYYSFMLSSCKYVGKLDDDYDVVLVNQLSPVMMAEAGVKYKKKHGARLVIYTLDLWPDSLTVGGIKKGSIPYKYYHRVSKRIYKSADKILVTSKEFKEYFHSEFGIDDCEYLPQYAETIFDPESCKKEPDGNIDLMFAGNVGIAQSVDTIIRAAALTKDIENLRFHIVGDGSELEKCKQLALSLDANNVIFHGRKPLEEMPKYYAMADAMLVTLYKNDVISKTLPGKMQTYMAAGKAIIGSIDGEAATVIREAQCGICAPAENAEALAECARELVNNKTLIRDYSENALAYYAKTFDSNTILELIEDHLHENIDDKLGLRNPQYR